MLFQFTQVGGKGKLITTCSVIGQFGWPYSFGVSRNLYPLRSGNAKYEQRPRIRGTLKFAKYPDRWNLMSTSFASDGRQFGAVSPTYNSNKYLTNLLFSVHTATASYLVFEGKKNSENQRGKSLVFATYSITICANGGASCDRLSNRLVLVSYPILAVTLIVTQRSS